MPHGITKRLLGNVVHCLLASVLAGCATGTNGVVPIGPDLYMIGRLGGMTDYSSSAVKARLFQEATVFCQGKNRVMVPENSTGQDAGVATYASAEVQFRCLLRSDPRASSSSGR